MRPGKPVGARGVTGRGNGGRGQHRSRGRLKARSPAIEDRPWSAVPQLACWPDLILETLFNESFLVRYVSVPK